MCRHLVNAPELPLPDSLHMSMFNLQNAGVEVLTNALVYKEPMRKYPLPLLNKVAFKSTKC